MESGELTFTQKRRLCALTGPLDYKELSMMEAADEDSAPDNGPVPRRTLLGLFLAESLGGRGDHHLCFCDREPGTRG